MYSNTPPRRPWRSSVTTAWLPDRMTKPSWWSTRGEGNKGVSGSIRAARAKQRRLNRHLCRFETGEWDD